MDDPTTRGFTRRDALRSLAAAGLAGVACVAIVAVPARGQGTKLAKAAVQYVDEGKVPHKDCDDCSQFVAGASADAPGSCRIVEGAISPHGHCIAFSPRPPR